MNAHAAHSASVYPVLEPLPAPAQTAAFPTFPPATSDDGLFAAETNNDCRHCKCDCYCNRLVSFCTRLKSQCRVAARHVSIGAVAKPCDRVGQLKSIRRDDVMPRMALFFATHGAATYCVTKAASEIKVDPAASHAE